MCAKLRVGLCQICGKHAALTGDHIPPQSLYPKPVRSRIIDMNKIDACEECNNGANEADEVFKVVAGLVARPPWDEELKHSVDASLAGNRKLSRKLERDSRLETIPSGGGGTVEAKVYQLTDDVREKFLLTAERCAKAFYYQEFGDVLVEKKELDIFHPELVHPNKRAALERRLAESSWRSVNSGTCEYVFIQMQTSEIVFILKVYDVIRLYYVIMDRKTCA